MRIVAKGRTISMNIKMIGVALGFLALGFLGATLLDEQEHIAQDSMHSTMKGMTSRLEGKTGDAFEQAFLEEMIVHHEGAIEMAEMMLAHTKRSELQALGNGIISAQKVEVEMMRNWLEQWFGE